jgi:hypothetical protein
VQNEYTPIILSKSRQQIVMTTMSATIQQQMSNYSKNIFKKIRLKINNLENETNVQYY